MSRRRFVLASLFAVTTSLAGNAFAAAGAGPVEVVERLESTLISVMQNAQKLGYAGRYKRLKPAIEETHDLPTIAQLAAGRHWNELSPEQQKRFIEAFSELSIATYADRFDGYSGEVFKVQGSHKLEAADVLVQSLLTDRQGGKTRFDYVLRQKEGRWAIINIIVDGVSDLAIKRSEYSSILRNEGADALIAKIRAKAAETGKGK